MAGHEIRISRVLRASAPIVWRAISERDLIAQWLMPNDFEPIVGHRFRLVSKPSPGFDGVVEAELLELEPPRRMLWAWKGGPIDTTVEFVVTPLGPERARIEVAQRGFVGARALAVSAILRLGWWDLLRRRLPSVLRPARGA